MAARLTCLVVILIVANFGNGEDTPSTIEQVLNVTDLPGGLSFVNKTNEKKDAIGLVKQLLVKNDPIDPKNPEVKEESGGNDGYKRPTRNAGFPMPGNVPRFSPRLQQMYQRYPLPYAGQNRIEPRRFGPGQWNQGGFVRPGPYYRPGFVPMNQNPGFWGGVPQRPFYNPQFIPRYPQVPVGPMGGQNGFAGQGNQNVNRFEEEDGVDINLDFTMPEVGMIVANVTETDEGTITAHIEMVMFPEGPDDNAPGQPQNAGFRPRL